MDSPAQLSPSSGALKNHEGSDVWAGGLWTDIEHLGVHFYIFQTARASLTLPPIKGGLYLI